MQMLCLFTTSFAVVSLLAQVVIVRAFNCTGEKPSLGGCINGAGDYRFGCAVQIHLLESDEEYRDMVVRHCTCITPENDWKMSELYVPDPSGAPGRGEFTLDRAKQYIDFVHDSGMRCINGHVLVWHNQIDTDGGPAAIRDWDLTRREWKEWLQSYIHTVVYSLQGYSYNMYGENYIKRWDVVSEAFVTPLQDYRFGRVGSDGSENWRDSHWFDAMGEEYLPLAFKWTKNATESAPGSPFSLTYLDHTIEQINDKSTHVLNTIDSLIKRGVPIDGVGFEGHLSTDIEILQGEFAPLDISSIRDNFRRFNDVETIKELAISEFDVRGDCDGFGSIYFHQQGIAYLNVARTFRMFPKFKYISTWGLTDKYSWIDEFNPGECNALPLSRDFEQKPAFCALVAAFNTEATPSCQGWTLSNCGDGICSGDEICIGGLNALQSAGDTANTINPLTGNEWIECDDCWGNPKAWLVSYCCTGNGCVSTNAVFSRICPNALFSWDKCPKAVST